MIVQTIRDGRVVSVDTRYDPAFGGTPPPAPPDPLSTDPPPVGFQTPGGPSPYWLYSDNTGSTLYLWGQAIAGTGTGVSVLSFGADPNGVAASDAAFASAIAAVQAANSGHGGLVIVPPGTYKITTGISWTVGASEVSALLLMPGVTINYTGSGSCLKIHGTKTGGGALVSRFSLLGSPIIDGTSATGSAAGVELGDIFRLYVENLWVQNFSGAGMIGLWLNNTVAWTEQAKVRAYAQTCTTHVQLDVNGTGTTSFDRCDLDLAVDQNTATFDGVVLNNGATLLSGSLKIRGNFSGSASALTSAVLRLTGSNAGNFSSILSSQVDIGVECDSALANGPVTIAFGAGSNLLGASSYGVMRFLAASTAFTSCTTNNGNISQFVGLITGDAALIGGVLQGQSNMADGSQNITATSATPIVSISRNVAAFTPYYIWIDIPHTGNGAVGTFTFSITGVGFNFASFDVELWTGSTITSFTINSSSATLINAVAPSVTLRLLRVRGRIQPNAAGTLTVNGTNSAGGSGVTINTGASIMVQQIGNP